MTMREVLGADGTTIVYRTFGDPTSRPLVLLHGWAQSSHCWGGPLLEDLSDRYRVIAVDLLLMGDLEFVSARLKLPHREVTSRRFVLAPLLELDPELTLPDGTRLADAMAALEEDLEAAEEGQEVRRTGSLIEE